MAKIILACDLDNTLIHSYKHYVDGDICVEHLNGKEQSYMHPRTYESIQYLPQDVLLVPVTSRSIEQYRRIRWTAGKFPHYALTTNGCILLTENIIDQSWAAESKRRIEPVTSEYTKLQDIISGQDGIERCRMVDNMYLFARFSTEGQAQKATLFYREHTDMEVILSNKKLYFFSPETNKGAAIERLKAMLKPDLLICAGDSEADISMLQKADIAIVPDNMPTGWLSTVNKYSRAEGAYFSDYIFEIL